MTSAGPPSAIPDEPVERVAELAVPVGPAQAHAVPPRVALARSRGGRQAILAALGAFGALFLLVRSGRTAGIDGALTLWLQRSPSPVLDGVMRAASWPGFPPQSRLIPPALAASLWALGLRLEAVFQVAAWSTALLSTAIKAVTRRPRPLVDPRVRAIAAPLGGSSFPSGHVLTYVGVYGFLAHLVAAHVPHRLARRLGVAGLLGLVGIVGPSRIHQGHHWPTDVLASYLLGLPFLALAVEAYRTTKDRLLRARSRRRRGGTGGVGAAGSGGAPR